MERVEDVMEYPNDPMVRDELISDGVDYSKLKGRVEDGRAAVAFSMFPVTVGEMMDIADAGAVMPPKSTWFEPKLLSGMFIHKLD